MVDISITGVATAIGGICGYVLRAVFTAGRKEANLTGTVEVHGRKIDEHGQRLDAHDDRFSGMHKDFVPRPEVERAFQSIEKSQAESKQLLLHLVTKEPIKPNLD